MAKKTELDEPAVYYIPNNFIAKGTVLGGTFKTRNVIEALIILIGIGYPITMLPMSLTVKIIVLCVVCLPGAVWALVGANGGPLSQFLLDFFRFKKFPHEYVYDVKHTELKPSEGSDGAAKANAKNITKKRGDKHGKKQ